jgi:UDP-3-O-[3-hydroxymyristoyl] glucosamine N-acyltransferase
VFGGNEGQIVQAKALLGLRRQSGGFSFLGTHVGKEERMRVGSKVRIKPSVDVSTVYHGRTAKVRRLPEPGRVWVAVEVELGGNTVEVDLRLDELEVLSISQARRLTSNIWQSKR